MGLTECSRGTAEEMQIPGQQCLCESDQETYKAKSRCHQYRLAGLRW